MGRNPGSLVAFSDYAGESQLFQYETFVTYLVGWNPIEPLAQELAKIRARIGGRIVQYKTRKDGVRAVALEDWLNVFAAVHR